jgi:acyl-CoA reductase-like NAD-dependent aldehyde dehydrogenase
VPKGTINLIAGVRDELVPQLASHRDVDGLLVAGAAFGSAGDIHRIGLRRILM